MPSLMKGHKWLERKDKLKRDKSPVVTYPVSAEVKYDEIRCHVLVSHDSTVQFLSYAGKPLANMERFAQQFSALASETGFWEFDCGFLVNNNFNDSYRWVRSTNGLPEDLRYVKYQFILFDLPESQHIYKIRKGQRNYVACMGGFDVPVSQSCYSEAEVRMYFEKVRGMGFEGLMIKSFTHLYEPGKRTDGWLKYKPSDDASGIIVKINQAYSLDGQPLGRAGSVDVLCDDGSEASPSGIAHELGVALWTQTGWIGKTIDFKFMERDRQGGYRHPVFVRLREETK